MHHFIVTTRRMNFRWAVHAYSSEEARRQARVEYQRLHGKDSDKGVEFFIRLDRT